MNQNDELIKEIGMLLHEKHPGQELTAEILFERIRRLQTSITALTSSPEVPKYKQYERTSNDINKVYDDFWKEIIEVDGRIDMEQLKKELSDFQFIIGEVSKVYCEITGGRMSKVTYYADTVLSEFHEAQQEEWKSYLKDEKEAWEDEATITAQPQDNAELIAEIEKYQKVWGIRELDSEGYILLSKCKAALSITEVVTENKRYEKALKDILLDPNSDNRHLKSGGYLDGYHRLLDIAEAALSTRNGEEV